MAEFVTDASGATWWPNLEPMLVSFFLLAEEITQVKEAIPWVRCASGNVWGLNCTIVDLKCLKFDNNKEEEEEEDNNNKEDNDIKEEDRRAKGGPKGLILEVGARRAPDF